MSISIFCVLLKCEWKRNVDERRKKKLFYKRWPKYIHQVNKCDSVWLGFAGFCILITEQNCLYTQELSLYCEQSVSMYAFNWVCVLVALWQFSGSRICQFVKMKCQIQLVAPIKIGSSFHKRSHKPHNHSSNKSNLDSLFLDWLKFVSIFFSLQLLFGKTLLWNCSFFYFFRIEIQLMWICVYVYKNNRENRCAGHSIDWQCITTY